MTLQYCRTTHPYKLTKINNKFIPRSRCPVPSLFTNTAVDSNTQRDITSENIKPNDRNDRLLKISGKP